MKTMHTPGPWSRNIKPASKYPTIFAGRCTHVAALKIEGLSASEVEGNADLIAAAPELLAAAIAVIERWDSPSWKDIPHTAEFIARLRQAVNSATGSAAGGNEERSGNV